MPPTVPAPSRILALGVDEMTSELDKRRSTGGNSPARCAVEACDKGVFFDGLCPFHGLEKYYREVKADFQIVPVGKAFPNQDGGGGPHGGRGGYGGRSGRREPR